MQFKAKCYDYTIQEDYLKMVFESACFFVTLEFQVEASTY